MNQNEDLKVLPQPLMGGEVEIENAINLLLKNGYLIGFNNEVDGGTLSMINVSAKLSRFYNEKMGNPQQPQQHAITKEKEPLITLQDFKAKAEIPWRVTIKRGTPQEQSYNTGQISREAEKYFNSKVVGKVNMDILIAKTRSYYKDEKNARPTLTNYFLNGLWLDIYQYYEAKETIEVKNQSFTGERSL